MVAYNMNSIATGIKDIPEAWIYKYYSELALKPIVQPFDGRIIKIRSFTNRDTEPSLCIYYDEKKDKYLWYDHSSARGGDAIDFVAMVISKTLGITMSRIITDYEKFIDSGGNLDDYDNTVIEVDNVRFSGNSRRYTTNDLDFWMQFKIPSHLLTEYDVKPFKDYDIIKNNKTVGTFSIYSFGFYCEKDGLYQIYQPENKVKYLNTRVDYLIGSDQLKFNADVCVITSGLKDLMALRALGLRVESVAPKSENTIIRYDRIEFLRSRYKHIITMFDNDEPGLKAMSNYKKIYDIPYIHINLEQDLAKNNKKNTLDFLKKHYAIYLDKLTQDE